jgi:hypothetical protein
MGRKTVVSIVWVFLVLVRLKLHMDVGHILAVVDFVVAVQLVGGYVPSSPACVGSFVPL